MQGCIFYNTIIIAYIYNTNVVDCLAMNYTRTTLRFHISEMSFSQAKKVLRVDIISVARIMQLPESCKCVVHALKDAEVHGRLL